MINDNEDLRKIEELVSEARMRLYKMLQDDDDIALEEVSKISDHLTHTLLEIKKFTDRAKKEA